MGKKSKKTKRKSELKIIFFIILVAAALFIVSTYAWFSTQRNVSITNLNGVVQVAEGLEISLDAETWANEIVLGDGDGQFSIIDDAYEGHRNLMPSELLPVSTLGLVTEEMANLELLRGKVSTSGKVSSLKEITEVAYDELTITNREDPKFAGHIAFDIFLKNSSKMTETENVLQLNYDSLVQIMPNEEGEDKSSTGLQNTVRVAFAKFGGTQDPGGNWNGVSEVSVDDATIILGETGATGTGDDVFITDVAIWEPNAGDHVDYIVRNNNNVIWNNATDPISPTIDIKYEENGQEKTRKGFAGTTVIPTYALKPGLQNGDNLVITNLYDWSGTNRDTLARQTALQTKRTSTTDYTIAEGVQNLISTSAPDTKEATLQTGRYDFKIPANKICRLRVYVWLEGQDVDCINYASHGGGVNINIGLVKGSQPGSHGAPDEDA